MTPEKKLDILLGLLEEELRVLALWESEPPSADKLASTEPFCIDTLTLPQWLQWLLLPKMHALLDQNLPLPTQCNISSVAMESFRDMDADTSRLLQIIEELDDTLNQTDPQ